MLLDYGSGLLAFALGVIVGAMIRDVGWFRVIEKIWLFTVSITDWEEVERIAKKKHS
ncbi:hypothetical protein [uncultured Microbulbifer sp.]|uniref:hypothetical protein n=1 Tax=uncultured Microbulbifer sp. TaxID=348147 RepID=UPI002626912F|nr:hypothetical protein [uncultured Microbulbifer sp.]